MKKKLVLAVGLVMSQWASGAAFQVNEFGADVMGVANSGTAASDKASVQWFNPAGMVNTKGDKISVAVNYIGPNADMKPLFARNSANVNILNTSRHDSPNEDAFIPNFYYIHHFSHGFVGGVGVTTPWGLKTYYEKDSVARFFGELSSLSTININPSLGYKINDMFSIGAGLNAQYAEAHLNSSADLSGLGLGEAHIHNYGNDWGYGYNLGAQFTPIRDLRIGLSYRSKIAYRLKGHTDVIGSTAQQNGIFGAIGIYDNAHTYVNTEIPAIVTLSGHYEVTNNWRVLADIQHTRWKDRIDQLKVITNDVLQTALHLNYNNSTKYSLGTEFAANNQFTLRAGIAFDESPTNNRDRTVRIPDSDRVWGTLGLNFKPTKKFDLDVGYMYVDFDKVRVDQRGAGSRALRADFSGHANVAAVQATYTFS